MKLDIDVIEYEFMFIKNDNNYYIICRELVREFILLV